VNFVLWGEDKSCKNTLALTFPKPLVDMEFDIGGFERSCRNLPHLPIKDWYNEGLIRLETFIMPFQIGEIDPIKNIIRPSKLVVGMKELFYEFAAKFIAHLKNPEIKSIVTNNNFKKLLESNSRLDKNRLDKKKKYGEYSHVLLTDEEHKKIQEKTGDVKKWIKILDEGIHLKAYKYSSHYLAILKWFKKDKSEPTGKKRSTLIPLEPLTETEKTESAQQAAELANKYLGVE